MRASGDASARAQADAESDASDQEERAERLDNAQLGALEFRYFHAHSQGKAAVRLWPNVRGVDLPHAGIHSHSRVRGDTCTCEGPGAPAEMW